MNGSIIIPEKFFLNRKKIRVIVDNDYCMENEFLGEADFTEKVITLCDTYAGKKLNKAEREKTYYHELIHMILDSMGKHNLKYNEDFVEDFAQRLYEYEKTKT
jgi:hypothetical protein